MVFGFVLDIVDYLYVVLEVRLHLLLPLATLVRLPLQLPFRKKVEIVSKQADENSPPPPHTRREGKKGLKANL